MQLKKLHNIQMVGFILNFKPAIKLKLFNDSKKIKFVENVSKLFLTALVL